MSDGFVIANRALSDDIVRELWRSVNGPFSELNGPLIRFAALVRAYAEPAASSGGEVTMVTPHDRAFKALYYHLVPFIEHRREFFCTVCRYRDPLGPDGNKLHDDDCPLRGLFNALEASVSPPAVDAVDPQGGSTPDCPRAHNPLLETAALAPLAREGPPQSENKAENKAENRTRGDSQPDV